MTPEQLAAARLRERADNVDRFLADNESERDGWLSSMPVAEMRRDAEELRSTADVLDAQAEEIERLKREKLELAGMVADLRDRVHDLEADSDHASGSAELAMHSLRSRLAEVEQKLAAEEEKNALYVDFAEHAKECAAHDQTKKKLAEVEHQAAECPVLRLERDDLMQRLAEVEAECLEQARLNGAGSEREARLLAKLAEVERKVAYYESALTIDDGELTALRGGGVAKAIKRTRVVDLIGKLAEVEAERDEQGRLKAMLCERKDKLEQEVVRLSRQLAESQAREARLRAALEKADEGLSHITRWAPVAADFEAGGKFDYAEGCGNADDAATLGAERCHFSLAEHARHALRAIDPVLYGPATPASDALGAIREAQRFLAVQTCEARQRALAALARCFGKPE
jgi:chromosome segregation ATPase